MVKRGPIFIGGEGRSGTTLLSVMLDSHPEISCGPELHFRGPVDLGPCILAAFAPHRALGDERPAGLPDEVRNGVNFIRRCLRMGVAEDVLEREIVAAMERQGSDLSAFPDRCRLVESLARHVQARKGASRWGIKIMRDIRILDRYAEIWPHAQFIHIVRDGRDVAASQIAEHASWGYADICAAASSWADTIRRVERLGQRFDVTQLRYEDLVAAPEAVMRRLLAHLDLAWSDRVLDHTASPHFLFDRPFDHPSFNGVSDPINSRTIGRFARDLSAQQITEYERIAGAELRGMGYFSQSFRPR